MRFCISLDLIQLRFRADIQLVVRADTDIAAPILISIILRIKILKKGIKNKPLSKMLGLWYNLMCVMIIYKPCL